MEVDYQQAKRIFLAALDLPVDERPAFVDQECGEDDELAETVKCLLKASESAKAGQLENLAGANRAQTEALADELQAEAKRQREQARRDAERN